MATLPSYVTVRMSNWSERAEPNVEVTEMERGPAKYRRINSRQTMRVSCSLLFLTTDDDLDFMTWHRDVLKEIGYFDMVHPRTGQVVSARFVEGDIGEVQSITGTDHLWQRDVVLEYMR